jgi:hypothetical protein
MAFLGGFGVAGLAADQLWASASQTAITADDINHAARVPGLELTEDERELILEGVNELRDNFDEIREVALDNSVSPALHFDPRLPGFDYDPGPRRFRPSRPSPVEVPEDLEELAFLPVSQLAQLVRFLRPPGDIFRASRPDYGGVWVRLNQASSATSPNISTNILTAFSMSATSMHSLVECSFWAPMPMTAISMPRLL